MSFPLLVFSRGCCNKVDFCDPLISKKKCSNSKTIIYGTMAFDILVFITSLIVGILGATSVIAMPAAAAHALIGVGGAIPVLWIAMYIALKLGFDATSRPKHT